MQHPIKTVHGLRHAIRTCREVLIQPRFGTSEAWVKITKIEAQRLTEGMPAMHTPDDAEMSDGHFATFDGEFLYLG